MTKHMSEKHDKDVEITDTSNDDANDSTSTVTTLDNLEGDKGNEDNLLGINDNLDVAEELERMANMVNIVSNIVSQCQECKLSSEVVAHKEGVIKTLDAEINTLETNLKKSEEAKANVIKEKKKMSTTLSQLRKDLKDYQNALAESHEKVSTLEIKLST